MKRILPALLVFAAGCEPPPPPPAPPVVSPPTTAPAQEEKADPKELVKRVEEALKTSGSWADLDKELTRYLSRHASDADVVAARGSVRERMGRLEEALQDFAQAVHLAPERPEIRRKRLKLLEDRKEWGMVATDLDFLVASRPEDIDLRLRRARARVRDGRHADAIEDFDKAVEAQPEDLDLRMERGDCHAEAKNREHAVADVTHVILRRPTASAYAIRGDYELRSLFLEKAEESFQKALELEPRNVLALTGMTRVWLRRKKPEPAIALANRLLEIDEKNASAWFFRGEAKSYTVHDHDPYCSGEAEGARQDLKRAVELDPVMEPAAKAILERLKR